MVPFTHVVNRTHERVNPQGRATFKRQLAALRRFARPILATLAIVSARLAAAIGPADPLPSAEVGVNSFADAPSSEHAAVVSSALRPPPYGPPEATSGIPSDTELEASSVHPT